MAIAKPGGGILSVRGRVGSASMRIRNRTGSIHGGAASRGRSTRSRAASTNGPVATSARAWVSASESTREAYRTAAASVLSDPGDTEPLDLTGYQWWQQENAIGGAFGLASPLLPVADDVRLGSLPSRWFVAPDGASASVEGLFFFTPDTGAPFPWLLYAGNTGPRMRTAWRDALSAVTTWDLQAGVPGVNAPALDVLLDPPVPDGHGMWVGSRVWSSGRLPSPLAIGPVERAPRGSEEVARIWARFGWSGRVFWMPSSDTYARVDLDPLHGNLVTSMPGVTASTTIGDVLDWWDGQGVTASRLTGSVDPSESHRAIADRPPVALTEGVQPLLMWTG